MFFYLLLNLSFSQSQISDEADLKIIIDTTVIELQDYKNAVLFDSQWRAEFFDDSLYDSITKIVKEDTFDNIDFPELSSDTLRRKITSTGFQNTISYKL